MIKFLVSILKILVVVVLLFIIGQFEYNDRKIQTYVVEFFKSKMISSSARKDNEKLEKKEVVTDFVDEKDKEELNNILD